MKRMIMILLTFILLQNFIIPEELYTLKGSVLDVSENPIPRAKVIIREVKRPLQVIIYSGEDGKFSAELKEGIYEIIVEIPYMSVEKKVINIPADLGKEVIFKVSSAILSEGITVTATRRADYAELAPIASSSLSEDEISRIQPRVLTEALLNVPGIQFSDVGPLRPRPIIRGLDTTRILVLVDGHRFNTFRMSTGAMGAELGLVDPQNVERIEVVRGAGSMLFGSDAIGGIINIITKKPAFSEKFKFDGSFFSGYESINNGRNLDLSFNLGFKNFSLRASAGWDKFDDYKSADRVVPNSQAESYNGDFKLGIKISENHSLSVGYIFKRAENVGFAQREKAPGFDASFPYNKRETISLNYQGESNLRLFKKISLDIYQQKWEREFLLTLTPPAMPFPLQSKTGYFMKNRGFDLQITSYPGGRHLLTYGINFIEDKSHDERIQRTFFGTPKEKVDNTTSVPDGRFLNFGAFLQDEMLLKKAEIKATLRFDQFYLKPSKTEFYKGPALEESKASSFSGNLGATFGLNDNLKIFGRVARGFRMPGLSERYYFGAPVPYAYFVPNPDLKPEISHGLDIGLRVKSKIFSGNITYFYNRLSNLLAWEPTTYNGSSKIGTIPVYHWANIEKGRIQGVEIEGEGKFESGKSVFTPFIIGSWQDGKNLIAGTSLPNILPYTLSYGIRFQKSKLWVEVSGRTVFGDRYVVAPSQPGAGYEEIKIDGFSVINLKGSLDFSELNLKILRLDGLRLNIGIENLTNRYYTEPFNTVPNPGRTFKTSLEIKF